METACKQSTKLHVNPPSPSSSFNTGQWGLLPCVFLRGSQSEQAVSAGKMLGWITGQNGDAAGSAGKSGLALELDPWPILEALTGFLSEKMTRSFLSHLRRLPLSLRSAPSRVRCLAPPEPTKKTMMSGQRSRSIKQPITSGARATYQNLLRTNRGMEVYLKNQTLRQPRRLWHLPRRVSC